MWYVVGVVLVVLYLSIFPLMWNEWNKQNPYWNARRYWHLVRTYLTWPALAIYVVVMVAWDFWPDIKQKFSKKS